MKNCDKIFRKSILKICWRRFDVWLTSLSSQRVKDKKCLNTKKTIGNGMFCANGISLRVETRSALLDEKHLIDKTDKFSLPLFQNAELAFFEGACIPMGCRKMFTDRRVFMFNNTLMKVSSCKADVIWNTQITCKRVNNALLIYDWRLDFCGLEVFLQFSADKHRL